MIRLILEMGRVHICCDVSMMSSFMVIPIIHLQQIYHMFVYLKDHHNERIVFDPTYPDIDFEDFEKKDWCMFYGDAKNELPHDMPEPL